MEELTGMMRGVPVLALLMLVVIFAVVVAIASDLVSGWRKAKVRGEAHSSYAFSRTLSKFLLYMGLITVCGCIDLLVHFVVWMFNYCYMVPVASMGMGVVLCITEIWSIREKADEKTRNSIKNAIDLVQKTLTHDQIVDLLAEALKKAGTTTIQAKEE